MTYKLIAILIALAGCGGSETPDGVDHSTTTCDISTGPNAGMPCERACATHRDETGISCTAESVTGTQAECDGTFGLEGTIGCCVVLPGETILRFVECIE